MLVSIIDSMNSEQLKGYAENVSFFLSLQKKGYRGEVFSFNKLKNSLAIHLNIDKLPPFCISLIHYLGYLAPLQPCLSLR